MMHIPPLPSLVIYYLELALLGDRRSDLERRPEADLLVREKFSSSRTSAAPVPLECIPTILEPQRELELVQQVGRKASFETADDVLSDVG